MKNSLLFLFLFIGLNSNAKYVAVPFHKMILMADLGLYGTIESQTEKQFVVKIESVVLSEFGKTEITINKFSDWTCAQRWEEYKKGQRVFLFLRKDKSSWQALSGGNEGECPIINEDVYLRGTSMNRSEYKNGIGFHNLGGRKSYFGSKINFKVFLNGISAIRRCYSYSGGNNGDGGKVKRKCSQTETDKLASENDFAKWLVQQCEAK
jgi:hypothetical protein